MEIQIYGKKEQLENPNFLNEVICPNQTHSNNIVEIKTGKEDLQDCDGIFTSKKNKFKLGIKTADCAAIVFEDENYYGIIHAGWRGAVNGIIEKMLKNFENPNIFISPFLKKFEIQKDFCYRAIFDKFQDRFFEEKDGKIIFNFEACIKSILGENAVSDERDTSKDENFYSYRQDKTKNRNFTIISN